MKIHLYRLEIRLDIKKILKNLHVLKQTYIIEFNKI
jgi:hypothetical protein